jgi:hypothetical protein
MWPETFSEIGEETEERAARATGPSDGNHREEQLHKWSNLKGAALILAATNKVHKESLVLVFQSSSSVEWQTFRVSVCVDRNCWDGIIAHLLVSNRANHKLISIQITQKVLPAIPPNQKKLFLQPYQQSSNYHTYIAVVVHAAMQVSLANMLTHQMQVRLRRRLDASILGKTGVFIHGHAEAT